MPGEPASDQRSRDQRPPDQQRPPRPVEPPHKPVQQGTKLALTVGLNFLAHGGYQYNTLITMPDGRALNYSGKQDSSGGTLLLGAAITPRGGLRRMTFGFTWNVGGLEAWTRPVIPSGTATPFNQIALNSQIRRNAAGRSPWGSSISPYVEHELGFILESRVRIGYQYWRQVGSYQGSFPIENSLTSPLARYDVRLSNSAHLVRLSINSYTSLDDTDPNSQSTRRKSGLVKQAGLQIGSNSTVTIFVGVGPSWTF